ncbi:MAG: hypothetical protein L3K52_10920 [Candidatus Thiothrix sulfatifontis]|nr:MAG: hypothetical protein L3K52_10920 [Candidatus Thiothrix sulfatifontis]
MAYTRPKSDIKLSPDEKRELLQEYFDYYQKVALSNPELLNSKLPRDAFDDLLNDIGELILTKSKKLSSKEGQVSSFLSNNPLPQKLEQYLPKEFRAYCLALNSLKQWLSAEQAATDRYIFGGTARQQYKQLTKNCLISGISADEFNIELHHPVRDGRPPIPLAKEIHEKIEEQTPTTKEKDKIMEIIYPIKKEGGRSWIMLKLGCELLLDIASTTKSKNIQASSKTFARKASKATNLSYQELLNWIKTKELI